MKYKKLIVLAVVLSVGVLAIVISRPDSDHTDDDRNEHTQFEARDEHTDEYEEGQVIELSK